MAERQDSADFITAFAVGAILGVGATLLLRPETSVSKRILKELAPFGRQIVRNARKTRKHVGRGARASAAAGRTAGRASRVLARELKGELADIVEAAKEEIAHSFERQLKQARRAAKRGVRHVRG